MTTEPTAADVVLPRAVMEQLADSVIDLCWRATPFGESAEGDIESYLLTAGSVHRLIGAAQGAGIAAAFRTLSSRLDPEAAS
jgi:hypothetical protein